VPGEQLAGARDDVAHVVRLAHVVVGTDLQRAHAILHLGLAGEDHHRQRLAGCVGAQLSQQIDAVSVREHDVEHHQADGLAGQQLPRLPEGGAGAHRHPGPLEGLAEVHAHGEAVVDHEHRGGHRRASGRP
jgi:hypothetical protein